MFLFRQNNTTTDNPVIGDIRRQISSTILLIFALGGAIYNIITYSTGISLTDGSPTAYGFGVAVVCGMTLLLIRRNLWVNVAIYFPIIMLLGLFMILPNQLSFIMVYFALILYSAIIVPLRAYATLCVFTLIWSIFQQQSSTDNFPYILLSSLVLLLGGMVFYVVYRFQNITTSATRTNRLLTASSNIAQAINIELDMQQLLDTTVNTIRDEFDFYHVQVFLIDERYEFANLVASTGEAGRQLLARNHRLPVGSQSVIGRVSQVGEPVIAQNTDADTVHALNVLLPDTRAELALPIIDSGSVIGALDVQSVNPDAFQALDIQALQITANQLAVAVRNARLFDQAQQNIQENKRLLFQYETNLRELDRLNRTLTKQSWDNYVVQSHINGVTLAGDRFIPQAHWSDTMRTATTNQRPHIVTVGEQKVVAIPIVLRGQVLGAIEVEFDVDAKITDSIEMIQSISQRLAISLESARLFEETQEATIQEQQINEIVSSYETAVTIDELLQVTLQQLQDSLGAEQGKIRLGTTTNHDSSSHLHNRNGGSSS